MVAGLLAVMLAAAVPEEVDTVVVCPRPLQQAIQPWIRYRTGQGHRIRMLSENSSAKKVRAAIRQVAKESKKLRYVLLVGDADPAARRFATVKARSLPTFHARAKVNVKWGSEPHIATDNPFADLDGDKLPDLAVGRLTADSPDELTVMIKKIIRYEQSLAGQWSRRISFVAGVGGFGAIVDNVLETTTKYFLTNGIPPSYETTMTYGSWRSPYCPDPRSFSRTSLERLNEGCMFWVYIGHGQRTYLDRVRVPGATFHILDTRDTKLMKSRQGNPIAIFLSCYTGAYDYPRDCLAEGMLRTHQGPVAVFSGSRVTMPYAMSVMAHGLMEQYFRHHRATLGDVIVQAKREMVAPKTVGVQRRMLDAVASVISPNRDQLDAERREHLLLFNLLGDPLTRLAHPQVIKLQVAKTAVAGQPIQVSGMTKVAGDVQIELVCPRDRSKHKPTYRAVFDGSSTSLRKYNLEYKKAHDRIWVAKRVKTQEGSFQTQITVPEQASGPSFVRVLVSGSRPGIFALGSAMVKIGE